MLPKKLFVADFFAGIGGIRLGFEQALGSDQSCVYACEINRSCCRTYKANFGHYPYGDITRIPLSKIPDFDILLAGFPCQAFSKAGKRLGFEDTRGTLFFEIARILEGKKPECFFLENVKGLTYHDNGNTFNVIIKVLEDLGYFVHYKILNAKDFGLPQNRERIYIIGFNRDYIFEFPEPINVPVQISDILEENVGDEFYLTEAYWKCLRDHKKRHEAKGHGFGYSIINPNGIANTLAVGGSGKENNILLDKKKEKNKDGVRFFTIRESARLQGFPDSFRFPVSNTQAYKQLANSVPVCVVRAIASEIYKTLTRRSVNKQLLSRWFF